MLFSVIANQRARTSVARTTALVARMASCVFQLAKVVMVQDATMVLELKRTLIMKSSM